MLSFVYNQLINFVPGNPERNGFLVPTMNMVNVMGKVIIALADISNESRADYENDLENCPRPGKNFSVHYTLRSANAFCTASDPSKKVNEWSTHGCSVSTIYS